MLIYKCAAMSHAELEKKIPLGRFGTAEEIADAAFFLAANEYANNCVLNLDGGLSATVCTHARHVTLWSGLLIQSRSRCFTSQPEGHRPSGRIVKCESN